MLVALNISDWSQTLILLVVLMLVAIGVLSRSSRLATSLLLVALSLILIRESGESMRFNESAIEFEIVARTDAELLPTRVYGSTRSGESCSFRAESRRLGEEYRQIPLRVISKDCNVFFGEELSGRGRVRASNEKRVAAALIIDEISHRDASPIWQKLDQFRKRYRSLFARGGDAASLVPGMVIGDTALQSEEFDAAMRLAGLSHLTAVSGANFSIVATIVLWLLSLWIRDRRVRIIITVATLLLFTVVVRPSPSVLRAGVMAAVVLYAQLRGNQRSSLTALSGAVAILLLVDPYQGGDAGFALSVLATFGIIVISPQLTRWMVEKWRFPHVIAEVIAIPVSATLLCTPIVIAISGKLSFASIPLNIIAAPLVPLVTIAGFAAFLAIPLTAFITPLPAEFLGYIAELGAWPIAAISRWSYFAPIIEMQASFVGGGIFILGLLSVMVIGFVTRSLKDRRVIAVVAILLAASTALAISSYRNWQLYQCDVGQGDALLLRTGSTSAMVIDVGPDPSSIDRCLRMAGVKTISLLVITHLHADHYGGLAGLMRGREVLRWWLPPQQGPSLTSETLGELEELIGRPPEFVQSGMSFHLANLSIDVLWPEGERAITPQLAGDGSDENNRSIALMIEKDLALIFAGGDIEPFAQAKIAARIDLSEVDIYKVSHHGSGFRDVNFDRELRPAVALISVGEKNPYGHPAQETLDELAPARILRTDLDGALRLTWWPIRVR